jgi:O-antigen/teichoic acid export membrane protein
MSGLRAGAIVFVAVGISNLCAYGFHLVSARTLGPSSYGDVAALAALIGIVALPLGGVQVFVGRHVAGGLAKGRPVDDQAYVSGFTSAMAVIGIAVSVVFVLISPLVKSGLGIASLPAVVLAAACTAPAFVAPAVVGAAQGVQRFVLLGFALAAPAAVRMILAAIALEAGLGVAGTMVASFAGALVAVALPLVALRRSFPPLLSWRPRLAKPDALALLPVVAGMLAITCLTIDDLVAAKIAFPSHEAGLYGAASLIGRVILYLPLAIVTVLLPHVAARVSAGKDASELLTTSLLCTGAFCLAFTAVYAALPHLIMRIAFGSKYEGSSSLLWMFGIAMTIYSLLNVILVYRLGHGETRTSWLLLGGVAVQAALFAAFHGSARELLVASIATGATLLAAAVLLPALTPSRVALPARETRHP